MPLEEYKDVIHRCFRCGYCKFSTGYTHYNCPVYNKYRLESCAPGGMLWLSRAVMMDEIEMNPGLAKIFYSCTMCSNCVDKCPIEFNKHIVDMIVAARTQVIDKPDVPPQVRNYLMNMLNTGNPWKRPQSERSGWAAGMQPRTFHQGHDYLYYVGDLGSFHEKGNKIARAIYQLLDNAAVNFGILGPEEHSDGNDVYTMGEKELFEYFVEENIRIFKEKGVKKVCTLSPHAYNAMKNYYPRLGGELEVYHYTHVLRENIENGQLKFTGKLDKKVTFHDPCFLGRWNDQYEAPRAVLKAIPGIELVEMERNKSDSFCCGGGGGNYYTDVLGSGTGSPARIRVREASETGAEILAVACPACMIMLEDAVKSENLNDVMEVKDISEIMYESIKV